MMLLLLALFSAALAVGVGGDCEQNIDCECFAPNLDIVFLVDGTGSMHTRIQQVKDGLNSFVSSLNEYDFNIRFAIVLYGGPIKELYLDWTDSVSKVQTYFNNIDVSSPSEGTHHMIHSTIEEPLLETMQIVLGQRMTPDYADSGFLELHNPELHNGETWKTGGKLGKGISEQYGQPNDASFAGYACVHPRALAAGSWTYNVCPRASDSPPCSSDAVSQWWPGEPKGVFSWSGGTSIKVKSGPHGMNGRAGAADFYYASTAPTPTPHSEVDWCQMVDKLNFRPEALPLMLVVTDDNSDLPTGLNNKYRKLHGCLFDMASTAVRDTDAPSGTPTACPSQTSQFCLDAPLAAWSRQGSCTGAYLQGLPSDSTVKPWLLDIYNRAQDIIDAGVWVSMFINSNKGLVKQQLADTGAQKYEKPAQYAGFDRDATLAELQKRGLACSLQAQVLAGSDSVQFQAFDINQLGDPAIVSAFFGSIAEQIGSKRCGTAKKKRQECACDACEANVCSPSTKKCVPFPNCNDPKCQALKKECSIDGQCVLSGATIANDECQACIPRLSQSKWSQNPCKAEGETCKTASCANGKCSFTIEASTCAIDGVCYADGQKKPGDVCYACRIRPGELASQTQWTYICAGQAPPTPASPTPMPTGNGGASTGPGGATTPAAPGGFPGWATALVLLVVLILVVAVFVLIVAVYKRQKQWNMEQLLEAARAGVTRKTTHANKAAGRSGGRGRTSSTVDLLSGDQFSEKRRRSSNAGKRNSGELF